MSGFIKFGTFLVSTRAVTAIKAHPGQGRVVVHCSINRPQIFVLECGPGEEEWTADDIARRIHLDAAVLNLTSMLNPDYEE
ncbi:hypothetical protein [Arthrobacter caoxuetaonis]|uniref:Uncharacterized protein n=1 Tax=Arthrobacter caoxuetaonis TaxID=2886935 RepID=A0A9X1SE73_9MICC|nr:hypothetical protein [Arthrobacter caoxuetaonis]MCC3299351.1 hypothetical protein [Arthrobacter caoxuetaonis]USQ59156.1 hypothetical protein NF551_18795 [Arthrobacter caoxuetaonis]